MAIVKKNLGRRYCGTLESRRPELGANVTPANLQEGDLEMAEELKKWLLTFGSPLPKEWGLLIGRLIAEIKRKEVTKNMTLTKEQREIMRHALGLNRRDSEYRNHFVTGPGSTDYPHCEALVAAGLMTKRVGNVLSGGDDIYSVTDAGRAALPQDNPKETI